MNSKKNSPEKNHEEDIDEVVARAGKALCMLAVKLDDLVANEELWLLPGPRKLLFVETGVAAAAEAVRT
jgi:hypothetical protein